MTKAQIESLKRDFLTWSGGFEPESIHQIVVYADYACPLKLSTEEVTDALINWMNMPTSPIDDASPASFQIRRNVDQQ